LQELVGWTQAKIGENVEDVVSRAAAKVEGEKLDAVGVLQARQQVMSQMRHLKRESRFVKPT
jgi:hypothetical protein